MTNKVVRNEQRKLTGAFVNGLAIATFAVGGLSQLALMMDHGSVDITTVAFVLICVIIALALHAMARAALRGMEE